MAGGAIYVERDFAGSVTAVRDLPYDDAAVSWHVFFTAAHDGILWNAYLPFRAKCGVRI